MIIIQIQSSKFNTYLTGHTQYNCNHENKIWTAHSLQNKLFDLALQSKNIVFLRQKWFHNCPAKTKFSLVGHKSNYKLSNCTLPRKLISLKVEWQYNVNICNSFYITLRKIKRITATEMALVCILWITFIWNWWFNQISWNA